MSKLSNRMKKLSASVVSAAMIIGSFSFNGGLLFQKDEVLQAASSDSIPPIQDAASAVNYSTILNGATDYGIMTLELYQRGHMETTFATSVFHNIPGDGFSNDVDFLPQGSTAQFIIGEVGETCDRETGRLNPGTVSILFWGKTTCSNFFVEGTEDVFTGFSSAAVITDGRYGNFNFGSDFFLNGTPKIVPNINSNPNTNVERLVNIQVRDTWSALLSQRANDPNYALDVSGDGPFVTLSANQTPDGPRYTAVLDVTDPAFEDKVVYVDVTPELLSAIGRSSGLTIKKNSSTIVVLNIDDDVVSGDDVITLGKLEVEVADLNLSVDSATSSQGNHTTHTSNVNNEICQKIIWNIMSDNKVNLDVTAGAMLAPYASDVEVVGSSAGWVVAPRVDVKAGEFHYLYQGGSTDGNGQMHFSLDKVFTHALSTSMTPDTTVPITAGAFNFFWDEYTDETYSSAVVGSHDEKSNDALSSVDFPMLTFSDPADSDHYVGRGDHNTFYFRITEDPSRTVSGIRNNPDAHIDLKIRVDYGPIRSLAPAGICLHAISTRTLSTCPAYSMI